MADISKIKIKNTTYDIKDAEAREALEDKADLVDGKIPADQLPSYVDDVIEGTMNSDNTSFIETGKTQALTPEKGKIYVDTTTNQSYRWSGSTFITIGKDLSGVIGTSDISGIGDGTLTGAIVELLENGGGSKILLNAPTNVTVKGGNGQATLTWTDPTDTTIDSGSLARWSSTVIVRKEGTAPTSESDGVVVLTSTTRNQYKTSGYTDTGLTNDVTYYYGIFPKSTDGFYTYTSTTAVIPKALEIVTWAEGSWEKIGEMIEAHYNGDINIGDYWSTGNTRRVLLNTIASGTTGEAQSQQYIDLTIIGIEHDDLVNSINGKSKAAITFHSKFCLATTGYMYSACNSPSYSLWSDSPRRTWCNNNFKNALPSGLVSLIKKVTKKTWRYCHNSYSGYSSYRTQQTTHDDVFLLSGFEVFGERFSNESTYGAVGQDGTQYDFYKTASNRIKYLGVDGTTAQYWWQRSSCVFSNGYSNFLTVITNGSASYNYASYAFGLAPGFCI